MPSYDGVVSVAEDEIPVMVELYHDLIRLSASGQEIGNWRPDQCEISLVSDATYSIKAENEILSFVPDQPTLFAAAVKGNGADTTVGVDLTEQIALGQVPTEAIREAPPAKPLTMSLFFALCAVTFGLAVWALVNIIV